MLHVPAAAAAADSDDGGTVNSINISINILHYYRRLTAQSNDIDDAVYCAKQKRAAERSI